MTRSLFVTLLVAAFVTTARGQGAPPQDAQKMLQAYRDMTPPEPDLARANDQKYVQDYIAQRTAFESKHAEAAKAFFDAYPDHPQAMPLMGERWISLMRLGRQAEVEQETQTLLAARKDGPSRAEIQYVRGMIAINSRSPDIKAAEAIVEDFIQAAPKDVRGGELLLGLAAKQPDKRDELMRRTAKRYPDSMVGKVAAGTVRQTEGMGKPFVLTFTELSSGKQVDLQEDFKGKVVVIDFWATWCGPCIAEMPEMKKLYAQYKDKGVEFIGVSLDLPEAKGGLKALKDYVAANQIAWPQYYQGNHWESEFSMGWGVQGIPCAFLVDREGKLVSTEARGNLEMMIPRLLAGQKLEQNEMELRH